MGHLKPNSIFDAAVIGAGPAGAATARWLALHGWSVALLERSRFESPRIGASLAPGVQELLGELGLGSEFLALGSRPSSGACALWGDTAVAPNASLQSRGGGSWHVDRRAFDQMLARAAEAAGVTLLKGVALQRSVRRDHAWDLQTTPGACPAQAAAPHLRARVLVDATGRRAQVARSLGAQRLQWDRLVGVALQWVATEPSDHGHVTVEATPEGWWVSAPLPNGARGASTRMVTMLMTDADLCAQMRLTAAGPWQACLGSAPLTRRRLRSARPISTPQVHCAHSQRLRRDEAANAAPWLAVGDATLAVDPVLGSGVTRALRSARAAADAVSAMLMQPRTWRTAVAAFEAGCDNDSTAYLLERAHRYAAEPGFDTPFWERRQALRKYLGTVDTRRVAIVA